MELWWNDEQGPKARAVLCPLSVLLDVAYKWQCLIADTTLCDETEAEAKRV